MKQKQLELVSPRVRRLNFQNRSLTNVNWLTLTSTRVQVCAVVFVLAFGWTIGNSYQLIEQYYDPQTAVAESHFFLLSVVLASLAGWAIAWRFGYLNKGRYARRLQLKVLVAQAALLCQALQQSETQPSFETMAVQLDKCQLFYRRALSYFHSLLVAACLLLFGSFIWYYDGNIFKPSFLLLNLLVVACLLLLAGLAFNYVKCEVWQAALHEIYRKERWLSWQRVKQLSYLVQLADCHGLQAEIEQMKQCHQAGCVMLLDEIDDTSLVIWHHPACGQSKQARQPLKRQSVCYDRIVD